MGRIGQIVGAVVVSALVVVGGSAGQSRYGVPVEQPVVQDEGGGDYVDPVVAEVATETTEKCVIPPTIAVGKYYEAEPSSIAYYKGFKVLQINLPTCWMFVQGKGQANALLTFWVNMRTLDLIRGLTAFYP